MAKKATAKKRAKPRPRRAAAKKSPNRARKRSRKVKQTKPKPRPRRRGTSIRKTDDKATVGQMHDTLRRFNAEFCASLPQHEQSGQHAQSGGYTHVEGDKYEGRKFDVYDGKFRVAGSDWIFTFHGGYFVEAERAMPPNFGGKDVEEVPAQTPSSPSQAPLAND